MNFGTVAILGPGLLGGSLALAVTELKLADRLIIYARKKSALDEMRAALPFAELTTEPGEAVKDADVVVLCLPIETMFKFICPIAHLFKPSALVTDVGSVKEIVDRDLAPLFAPNAHWIGSHPMAGSEKSGFGAARSNLFKGATVVITPTAKTSLIAQNRAREFWEALGGRVIALPPGKHDIKVAQISHLPHLLAATLVNHVQYAEPEALELVGGGFRDSTRIASGSPDLWAEILSANSEAVAHALGPFINQLEGLKKNLQDSDKEGLKQYLRKILKNAQDVRSNLPERPSKTS
jgi:prephenate dehydrogenase